MQSLNAYGAKIYEYPVSVAEMKLELGLSGNEMDEVILTYIGLAFMNTAPEAEWNETDVIRAAKLRALRNLLAQDDIYREIVREEYAAKREQRAAMAVAAE